MGTHFVLTMEAGKFDVEKPPILLYVKGSDGGYRLGGVGYLYDAPAGPDWATGQSAVSRSRWRLWHQHDNICMGPQPRKSSQPERSAVHGKGRPLRREELLGVVLHAWIWKDNPQGVFSPENPAAK